MPLTFIMRHGMKSTQCLQGFREWLMKAIMRHWTQIRMAIREHRLETWTRNADHKRTQLLVHDLARGGSLRHADTPPGEGGIRGADRGGVSTSMDSRKQDF